MRRSISNSAASLLLLFSLLGHSPLAAEGPAVIDDSALKRDFVKKLSALLDEGKATPAAELIAELKKQKSGAIDLGKSGEDPSTVIDSSPYAAALPSTLLFGHLYKCNKCNKWHGSNAGGVVIGKDGIAVTNYHVIDSEKAAAFGAMDSRGNLFPVLKVLASSEKDDLAIVQLGDCDLPPVSLATTANPGDAVHLLSHPDGHFFSYTRGVVSRYYLLGKKRAERMQITADFARGSSGCGVFTSAGKLTGLVASTNSIYYKQKDGEDENLQMVIKTCVPVARIKALINP